MAISYRDKWKVLGLLRNVFYLGGQTDDGMVGNSNFEMTVNIKYYNWGHIGQNWGVPFM